MKKKKDPAMEGYGRSRVFIKSPRKNPEEFIKHSNLEEVTFMTNNNLLKKNSDLNNNVSVQI